MTMEWTKLGNCLNVKEREEGRGRGIMTRQTNASDDKGRYLPSSSINAPVVIL
jgi:hypothetical protein